MSLIKDGKIYRTPEEQLLHLTEKHLEQISFNENVFRKLQELTIASNLGGFNLVRHSFHGGYSYKLISVSLSFQNQELPQLEKGDFLTFYSYAVNDIPAYGFYKGDKEVDIVFGGDYIMAYGALTCHKHSTGEKFNCYATMEEGESTSLKNLNPNNYKKQLFTVLEDLDFRCRTQYVSYDVNGDGNYEFIYVGVDRNGRDGYSIHSSNSSNYSIVKERLKHNDILITTENIYDIINYETGERGSNIGDVFEFRGGNEYILIGNIRGPAGARGEKGERGEQGIQGVQGIQGIQGQKGERGEKGDSGLTLDIKTGVLSNPSQLPPFQEAEIGDGYRIINTSGSVISYDLYFKTSNGTDWDIQPNWGGVKGDKGDKGDTGLQGSEGIQGPQGEKGESGLTGSIYFGDNTNTQLEEGLDFIRWNKGVLRIRVYGRKDSMTQALTKLQVNDSTYEVEENTVLEIVIYHSINYYYVTGINGNGDVIRQPYLNSISLNITHAGPDWSFYTVELIPMP